MSARDLLRQDAEKDLLRFTLVGSVDDGKSTLIGRLLHDARGIYEDQLASVRKASRTQGTTGEGIDFSLITDGLKAEREQKITIDVAYRYFSTPRRKFIIADTPGHEQYTRNMATGASTANLAVVLIDARYGVRPQSRRHAFIASILGISHMVIAVNKMDLVDYSREVFERIRADYTAFSARLQIPDTTFIPISALKGDNVVEPSPNMPWYRGCPLLPHLETVHIASDANLIDLRFPVQYVVRPNLDFRGYAGSMASGVIRKGDEILCLPSGRPTRVKAIVTYDGELKEAFPPQAVTVVLEDNVDLSRGGMLVHPHNLPHSGDRVDAMLVWMDQEAGRPGAHYLVKHTTSTVPAVLESILYSVDVNTLRREKAEWLALNSIGRASLELRRQLLWDPYTQNRATGSIILIDRLSNRTVAAGMILHRDPSQASAYQLATQPTTRQANLVPANGKVSRAEREALAGQRGAVVWLTGLSGSGKSTVAYELEKRLVASGHPAYVLDGDNLRTGLCSGLGFSPEDRAENIRRAGEVAALFADAGLIAITSFISPYRADRERARSRVPEGSFLEVFLDVPLKVCEERDPKGLYRKARAGQIRDFTGIDAPYERPECPDLALPTHQLSLEEEVGRVMALLRGRGILGSVQARIADSQETPGATAHLSAAPPPIPAA